MTDEFNEERLRAWAEALKVGAPVTPDEARERALAAIGRRRTQRRRRMAVAAAGIVLLAGLGGLVRSGVTDGTVTTGSPAPASLDVFADQVRGVPTTVLGESADASYSYRRGVMTWRSQPTSGADSYEEQIWVSRDGVARRDVNPAAPPDAPMPPNLARLIPSSLYLELPDDADAVEAALATRDLAFTSEVSPLLVDALTHAGLPGRARAGMLRALGRLGMEPVASAEPGPGLFRAEGPVGEDGLRLWADFDLRTGSVVAWSWYRPSDSGDPLSFWRFTVVETDLRRDTEGA